jgi:hypothetical protein
MPLAKFRNGWDTKAPEVPLLAFVFLYFHMKQRVSPVSHDICSPTRLPRAIRQLSLTDTTSRELHATKWPSRDCMHSSPNIRANAGAAPTYKLTAFERLRELTGTKARPSQNRAGRQPEPNKSGRFGMVEFRFRLRPTIGGRLAATQPLATTFSKTDLGGPNGSPASGKAHQLGWGCFAHPPQLMGFPEGRCRLDPQSRVLRRTSQWVGSLPGALLIKALLKPY